MSEPTAPHQPDSVDNTDNVDAPLPEQTPEQTSEQTEDTVIPENPSPPDSDNLDSDSKIAPEAAIISAKSKKQSRVNHIWWLPLIALLMVSYIAINHFTSKGPLVTIAFSSAEGLEVNKTKAKYKDVVIGKVEKITLDDDFKGVKVAVRMDKSSEHLLRQNTRFWVVKPRIGITQVSGLNTLLSGNYITLEPDRNEQSDYRYEFSGLENPPIISQSEPGLRITLLSTKATSLYPGTEVYYKGMAVGTVNRVYFSDDYLWVKADVFIASPHDKLIKQTTKFWSSSGISVDASTSGVEVVMESVETLIAGGITFETPITLSQDVDVPVDNGTEYILFANKKSAEEQNTGRKYYFVTYFNGSIKGLEVGAAITIQGMKVGKVKDIRLMFDTDVATTRIPVLFEIYEDSFTLFASQEATVDDSIEIDNQINIKGLTERLVGQGLRTQLETASLLTGAKNIALIFDPTQRHSADAVALQEDPITGYTLLPSTQQSFDALTAGVTNVVNKVNALPLEEIADNLNDLLGSANSKVSELSLDDTMTRINKLLSNADKKIDQLELAQTVKELNALLKEGRTLSKTAKSTLNSLNASVSDLVSTTEAAMAGYSADAPLYHNLNLTLEQLNDTLSSLKTVTDMLDRHPNALVFGEDKPEAPKQSYWDKNDD